MSKMYKSTIELGGIPKTLVVVNYKEDGELTQSKSVDQLHHIHIFDRSGSMSGSIRALVEDIKKTIEFIPDGDYVSIIWFSGEGQQKILIKGAKKDLGLFKLLDSVASTVGLTCFSESLKLVDEIITDLEAICPNFSVTLFTDGQPVVSWSDEEERSLKAVDVWKDKVIALNTVGYGNYYNQEFLKSLSEKTMFGTMVHSSNINEYMTIFSHNYEKVAELCMDRAEFECLGNELLYINPKSTKLSKDLILLRMLDKKKNQFVILSDKSDFAFLMNGETFYSNDITAKVPANTINSISYAYAYENYYKGNRQLALDILAKTLKDKYLVDEQFKAFTFDEVSEYSKKLLKAVFSPKGKHLQGECPENYLPKDDAPCIMDVLKILTNGESYYVYNSNYKRIGLAQTDSFNLFVKDQGEVITSLDELIFNKEKLNISIRSRIKGTVTLNPKQADKVGLPRVIGSYMFRNQTLVKDGYLNMDTIKVLTDADTLQKLKDIDSTLLTPNTFVYEVEKLDDTDSSLFRVSLDLITLPVINRMYLGDSSNIDAVMKNTLATLELEAKQKVVNYFLKATKTSSPDEETVQIPYAKPEIYTVEQFDVLKEHGLDSKMCYVGVDMAKAEVTDTTDYYESRELSFGIKGSASLPSVNDVIKKIKDGGKLNASATIMKDYIMDLQHRYNLTLDKESNPICLIGETVISPTDGFMEFFETLELRKIKDDLFNLRVELASMKIAKILTGAWFEGLTPDGKGGYTYVSEGLTLVVKTDKVKEYCS